MTHNRGARSHSLRSYIGPTSDVRERGWPCMKLIGRMSTRSCDALPLHKATSQKQDRALS